MIFLPLHRQQKLFQNPFLIRTLASGFFALMITGASAAIIPPERLPAWKGNVGVPGGIPNRSTIYTTIPAGASTATIQNAINACPSNQVVLLSPGTYTLTTSLNLKSGVTVRGSGMDVTILNASINNAIQASASFSDDYGAPVKANHVSWIGNYQQGANVLQLATTNLAGGSEAVPVGNLVMIDQQSDANCSATGGYGLQGVWWSLANPTTGADRYQHQISYVTAKSGHAITIDPPIVMANYNSLSQPQVWFEVSSGPIQYAGVEHLTLHNTGGNNSARGISFSYTYGCWVLDCKVTNFRYDISTYFCVRNEFRHCYIGGLSGSGDDYDFSLFYQGGCLFEDNIVNSFNSAFLLESCIGDAYAYNYCTNANSTAGGNMNSGCFNSHGGNNAMNLLEGNYFTQVSLDNGWGSAFGFVLFRNRITGWDNPNATYYNYVAAIDDYSMNRFMTFVGNVLGTSGKNTVYEANGTGANLVYVTQLSIAGYAPSPDPVVSSSMVRAMNWDSATKTNGGLVSSGFTAGDVPISLLYDTKPAYFGNLAWPPIDPTNPIYSSSHTNIPAGYRLNFGVDLATGPINQPPIAAAAVTPASGTAPLSVDFSSSGSYDPEGTRLTYLWNFGDGTTNTTANPSHTYTLAGDYQVQLQVSDGTNSTTSGNLLIHVAGLLAAYGFEETNSTQIINAVTRLTDGAFTNATRVPGLYGTAIAFNGTNSVASITDALVSSITSNLTIEAWVKPATTSSWRPVVGKANNQSQIAYVLQGVTPQNSLPSLYVSPGPNNLAGPTPLPTNTWSHLAATFDGTNLCLYVNGTQVASQQQTGALSPANTPLTIGSDGLLEAFWSGTIDEVRIYNTALSATAIQADMNTPVMSLKPAPPQNLRVVSPP